MKRTVLVALTAVAALPLLSACTTWNERVNHEQQETYSTGAESLQNDRNTAAKNVRWVPSDARDVTIPAKTNGPAVVLKYTGQVPADCKAATPVNGPKALSPDWLPKDVEKKADKDCDGFQVGTVDGVVYGWVRAEEYKKAE
ncbi:hypothetical protein D5S17_07490 [Pseudonocardiaceae bacterium YIM PH 21723]|nr:hypothetical protein D5S17_07490 [Pseudonocardiaceae bacterium YIM PH 21723]